METKDLSEAKACETDASRAEAEMWLNAKTGMDTYLTYKKYWNIAMFQEVLPNVKFNNIRY